ncbi:alpha/beta hydrolase [Nocardioides sp. Arc9.136]|uniref:alpha/beta hydrolase n=1 Tax=Nocardioides sp. Arc9.136 TaxID=2996826 RepID=UPI002665CF64|nr:hypothetical protein [Nocardioides sp. Arc9.136]WKN48493.1 hypothetical protein OSR43_21020 [Nocardioides sp. Arc9.136]
MRQRAVSVLVGLVGLALGGAALAVPSYAEPAVRPAPARVTEVAGPGAPAVRPARVVSRPVEFDVSNANETSALCLSDNRAHVLRGRLVGPRRAVAGAGAKVRVNVLVHDAGTGAWFWNLRRVPGVDYATRLARRGETSLVLDRLGYDRSPLADGNATCLGAQATMLHQVVQHLYSGVYRFADRSHEDDQPPHATHVVLHGHGTGATLAQLEAAEFDDVAGLVLMSAPTATPTALAVREAADQLARCLGGGGYSEHGASAADFRRLLFASATARVRSLATAKRNPTPCGDVSSLLAALGSATVTAGRVEVPVLLLTGDRDTRVRPLSQRAAERLFATSERVTARTVAGAGSALPLERRAGRVRSTVLRWLADVRPTL